MSSSATSRQRFFVYAPDKKDEGTFQKRMSVRPKHVEAMKQLNTDGYIRVGGAVMTPDSDKMMIGSVFIVEADSIDEVKKKVEEDVYYTSDVWDKERLEILPFFAATDIS